MINDKYLNGSSTYIQTLRIEFQTIPNIFLDIIEFHIYNGSKLPT